MLEIHRVEDAQENQFTVSTSEGFIKVVGTSEFVVRCIKDLCENSQVFQEGLKDSLEGETIESIAQKMEAGGFDKNVIKNFVAQASGKNE